MLNSIEKNMPRGSSKRSIEGSNDEVVQALRVLLKLKNKTTTEEWADICLEATQLNTPTGVNTYMKVADQLRETAALLEARSTPYEKKHLAPASP